MPMSDRELDEFLGAPRLAHFATTSGNGKPRVRPLWYVYTDGAFWFTTRSEARWTGADVVAGSPVAISIASEDRPYRAVLARGSAEVWDEDRDGWLDRIASKYGRVEGRRWLTRALREPDRVVMRMIPDTVVSWDYGKGDYSHQDARRPGAASS
jgi:nitroimidazol reductase NimA-like FMN-containing flavoprotein (pyridoxamine 5'-phosphate oxidase superfamily)